MLVTTAAKTHDQRKVIQFTLHFERNREYYSLTFLNMSSSFKRKDELVAFDPITCFEVASFL